MSLSRRRFASSMLLSAVASSTGTFAFAAESAGKRTYPSKPVRLIIGYTAGGTSNFVANTLSDGVAARLGQPLILENHPGAGGVIGTQIVVDAPADGHVIGYTSNAFITVAPNLMPVPYDPFVDLEPVALIGGTINILAAHPSLPVRTVKEFIAYAKANPGKLFYGSSGNATGNHITVEYLKRQTGIDAVHVPYKGMASALTDLMAGRLHFVIDPGLTSHIESGRLRALGIADAERHPNPALANLEYMGKSIPEWDPPRWYNIVTAPKGTPEAVKDRIAAAVHGTLAEPGIREKLAQISYKAGEPANRDDLAKRLVIERDNMKRLLTETDIRLG